MVVPIFYNGPTFYSSKLPIAVRDLDSPSNTWFLGPTESAIQNGVLIGSAVFKVFEEVVTDRLTDRPTDRLRYSVCNNRPALST